MLNETVWSFARSINRPSGRLVLLSLLNVTLRRNKFVLETGMFLDLVANKG